MAGIRWTGVVLLAASLPALAEPQALLSQLGAGAQAVPYEGVVVYRAPQVTEVLRVSRDWAQGRPRDHLTTLTGAPRELRQDAGEVSCRFGDGAVRRAALAASALDPGPAALGGPAGWYELRDSGSGQVAGRPCRGVSIAPRDAFRYGYELCADEATAVPLRIALVDGAGRSLESLTFTEISFGPAAPAARPARARRTAAAAQPPEPGRWTLGALPPGYAVVSRSRLSSRDAVPATDHVLLSDGLSVISVFAATAAPGDAAEGLARLGAVNAYVRRVGPLHVTVMGEVPEAAVRLIGEGLGPATAAATPVSRR